MPAFRNDTDVTRVLDLPLPDGRIAIEPGESAEVSDAGAVFVRSRGYVVVEVADPPAPAPGEAPAPTPRGRAAAKKDT